MITRLIPGKYYTVIEGRFNGITAVAIQTESNDVHVLTSPDFGDDDEISFFGCFESLREATEKEELELRRRMDDK